jgi:hypothetical protein
MAERNYRFCCQITDETTGEVVETDWCTITDARIDEFGGCEQVDHVTGKLLRNWRNFARAEHEHHGLQEPPQEPRSVTVARIRAVAEGSR